MLLDALISSTAKDLSYTMSDMPVIDLQALLLERDDINAGVVQQVRQALVETPEQFRLLRSTLDKLEDKLDADDDPSDNTVIKLGIINYLVGRVGRSAELLECPTTPLGKFYRGQALTDLGEYDKALEALEDAGKSGYADGEVKLQRAAAYRKLGKLDESEAELDSLDDYLKTTADYYFQKGSILLAKGENDDAIEHLEKALEVDPNHGGVLFQLAYQCDMAGIDDQAINFYERCLRLPPAHVGTLINLGILYEDTEQYEKACYCYEQVLKVYPNHARARLFLRDSKASRSQEVEHEDDVRTEYNAVLDTPITDFELSVRSRNCLKKMNITTLGDLTRCSEPQLLASKNFGETSLTEIKNILAMKGLRLGQNVDQPSKRSRPSINPEEYSPEEQQYLARPVIDLNLSVRARKCMGWLNIATVGDLIAHTGDELMGCKNFGVTSLVEVQERLAVWGLKLRGD